jgi:hypothetical protein
MDPIASSETAPESPQQTAGQVALRLLSSGRVGAFYLLLALVFTWPLARHPLSVLGSTAGPGDSYLNLWILGWDLHTIATRPLAILTGRVFDANIYFPATGTLAYSDHLLLQAICLSPLYLLTRNLVLCYNALLVLSLAACALAMHTYVRRVTGLQRPALAAGIAWGFAPYHFGHLIHLNLQTLYFLPLAFLLLHRVVDGARKKDAWLLGVVLGVQAIASAYYGIIGGLGLAAGAMGLLAGVRWQRWGSIVRRLALSALIGVTLAAPVAFQYWRVQQREGFGRTLFEATEGSAAPASYLLAPSTNLLYGRAGPLALQAAPASGHKLTEQVLFPGFAVAVLAAAGLWAARRREYRAVVLAYALLVAAGFVLSLGPGSGRPLYGALHRLVFGFQGIRAPARFGILVLFGLAGLAGLGVRELLSRRSRIGPAVVAGAIGAMLIEYANAPVPYVPAPTIETAVGKWLRAAPEPGAVVYLPLTLDPADTTSTMVQSLAHGRPIVNGSSAQRPSFYSALVDTMAGFPSGESLRALHDLPVRFVVSRRPIDIAGAPLVERARFDEGTIYELRWTAEAEAGLERERLDSISVPAPGAIPFEAGEAAVYSVAWTSGPLAAPAGQVLLNVEPGRGDAKYDLRATGRTASWISRVFEADDQFVSSVDSQLRSITYEQHLREGRRRVDRQITFDRALRLVRLRQGGGQDVSLPIPPDAMDPVSAFYYVRSLPLARQGALRIPINEVGRNIVLELHPAIAEPVVHLGGLVDALRVESQLSLGSGRPIPLRVIAWFSRDSRQIPLVIQLDGLPGAGSFKLELESFSAGLPARAK